MEWYRGPEGDQRIWYEETEIEQIMSDELARAKLTPTPTSPVTDLERFIESHLKADLDQFAYLPVGVLGLTQFVAGKRPAVSISAELTNAADEGPAGLTGRWRATLAHEAAHVVLHRYLFDPVLAQPDLFGATVPHETPSGGLMRCLKRDISPVRGLGPRRRADWREVQANRGMAALLMPRMTFRRLASQRITAEALTNLTSGSPTAAHLANQMADSFSVSKQAATIRLETLGIITTADLAYLPGL
jgi:hypothetical protein